jgi:hypothetical protein
VQDCRRYMTSTLTRPRANDVPRPTLHTPKADMTSVRPAAYPASTAGEQTRGIRSWWVAREEVLAGLVLRSGPRNPERGVW